MSVSQVHNLAILIDAENVPARFADRLFEEVAAIGYARVRRGYGDFTGLWSAAWASAFARHAVVPRQHFSVGRGKNSADIALTVDAMDLLNDGGLDAICLVSGDSDFCPLAFRIREKGVPLYGFGRSDTPERLRLACRRFVYLESLLPESAVTMPVAHTNVSKPDATAYGLLRRALVHAQSQEGWAQLTHVEQTLLRLRPDFDPRTYGHNSLLSLVSRMKEFAIDLQNDGGPRIRPRRKQRM
ncbi:NYN domain-containing protein [Mesorhizobium sp. AR02]|uniref:NYN domain-containing protein n=1 Tax=Mesorhizobium sp. AR02 TaxID=2865837 RepID=UPI002160C1DF|nr:NYN domain-containing protein [Mesorhizobium sp. AR02]UVK54905.1 NYN domain-containing protein [Mesorhizobium sp. AR02]